jgi:hypothetical protein
VLRTALIAPLAALGLLPMTAAHAADAVTCTIVDTSPDTVVIGLAPETFQIDVATDCDAERDVGGTR